MTRRRAGLVVACALAVALSSPAVVRAEGGDEAEPTTVSGVADFKLTSDTARVSLRLLFAASGEPSRLRIEVVRAGVMQAVAWYDPERLLVLAPAQGLVHEGPPTRETLEAALGLPFCPADMLFALRGGMGKAPPPCDVADVSSEATGSGEEGAIELRRGGAKPTRLRFSRFRDVAGRQWPHRVTLDTTTAHALIDIVALGRGPLAPMPPSADQVAAARHVDAATLAESLGIDRGGDAPLERPAETHGHPLGR